MKNIHQQIFQDCSHDLIGLPYFAFDCWQLVKLFYHKVFQIELLRYEYKDPNDENDISNLIDASKHSYQKVSKPEFGDIILLRIHGLPAHVGIYLNEKQFLHTTKNTGSLIDSLPNWKNKIVGYYRYAKN